MVTETIQQNYEEDKLHVDCIDSFFVTFLPNNEISV